MTLYCATILGCCIVQLKKRQTRHQVPRCWPHSTVCRSPGHGIWSTWANGDIPMYIWPDNRNTGRFLEPPFRSQEPFPLPETEVTSSKMAGGSGNGSWLLNGGSKNLPILLPPLIGWAQTKNHPRDTCVEWSIIPRPTSHIGPLENFHTLRWRPFHKRHF